MTARVPADGLARLGGVAHWAFILEREWERVFRFETELSFPEIASLYIPFWHHWANLGGDSANLRQNKIRPDLERSGGPGGNVLKTGIFCSRQPMSRPGYFSRKLAGSRRFNQDTLRQRSDNRRDINNYARTGQTLQPQWRPALTLRLSSEIPAPSADASASCFLPTPEISGLVIISGHSEALNA